MEIGEFGYSEESPVRLEIFLIIYFSNQKYEESRLIFLF